MIYIQHKDQIYQSNKLKNIFGIEANMGLKDGINVWGIIVVLNFVNNIFVQLIVI